MQLHLAAAPPLILTFLFKYKFVGGQFYEDSVQTVGNTFFLVGISCISFGIFHNFSIFDFKQSILNIILYQGLSKVKTK